MRQTFKYLGLHLLPGALLLLFYGITAPLFVAAGFPSLFAALLGTLLVVIPFELFFLRQQRQKQTDGQALLQVIPYREPVPWWQYVAIIVILFTWSLGIALLFSPLDRFLADNLFFWLPDWFGVVDFSHATSLGRTATLMLWVPVLGVVAPIVEEFYFRGYLLPRIAHWRWAPLVHSALFSLQHFLQPAGFITRTILFLPVAYIVQKKRNIYLSIIWHVALNLTTVALQIA